MAFNNYSEEESEGASSKYNEAFLKMHRFHDLQKLSALARINPLAINPIYNIYNYQIILSSNDSLLLEVWGKLTDDEKNNILGLKNAIESIIKKYPIHENKKNFALNKNELRINNSNWNVLSRALFDYETKIRELISRTKYDSPDYDMDEEGL